MIWNPSPGWIAKTANLIDWLDTCVFPASMIHLFVCHGSWQNWRISIDPSWHDGWWPTITGIGVSLGPKRFGRNLGNMGPNGFKHLWLVRRTPSRVWSSKSSLASSDTVPSPSQVSPFGTKIVVFQELYVSFVPGHEAYIITWSDSQNLVGSAQLLVKFGSQFKGFTLIVVR